MNKPEILSDEAWEKINVKMGVDVIGIALNLDNRYTPMQQAELIVERCNLAAQAQRDDTYKKTLEQVIERLKEWQEVGTHLVSREAIKALKSQLEEVEK